MSDSKGFTTESSTQEKVCLCLANDCNSVLCVCDQYSNFTFDDIAPPSPPSHPNLGDLKLPEFLCTSPLSLSDTSPDMVGASIKMGDIMPVLYSQKVSHELYNYIETECFLPLGDIKTPTQACDKLRAQFTLMAEDLLAIPKLKWSSIAAECIRVIKKYFGQYISGVDAPILMFYFHKGDHQIDDVLRFGVEDDLQRTSAIIHLLSQ